MPGGFASGHRINPKRFLECPRQNSPATGTTYNGPQNTPKTIQCDKKSTCWAPPKSWISGLGAVVRHLHCPSPIQGWYHQFGYTPAAPGTPRSGFLG